MENELGADVGLYESLVRAQSDIGEAVLILEAGRVVFSNEAACRIFGYGGEEIKTFPSFAGLVHPDERQRILEIYRRHLAGEPAKASYHIGGLGKDGARLELEIAIAPPVNVNGMMRTVAVLLDITGRKRQEQMLAKTLAELERQKFALDQHSIVSIADAGGSILYANDKFSEISQYSRQELLGRNHRLLKSGWHSDEFFAQMWQTIVQGRVWHGEIKNRKKDGGFYWVSSTIVPFLDASGLPYQYVSIRTDITLQKLHAEELEQARQLAEACSRAKSEFVSRMSHELRTPLNAVLGFAQLLETDQVDRLTPSQKENTEHILKAGWHLLELVNEILDLSQIEAGKMRVFIEDVPLAELLRQCISLVVPLAQAHQIKITDQVSPCLPHVVRADSLRLKQVLLNLISNAIKYNREHGSVILDCKQLQNGRLRISVADTGVGISASKLDQLFQPFNRAGADATSIEGTGIGLAITKRLVELMGGEIGVSSVEGKGSCFWVELGEVARGASGADAADGASLPFSKRTLLYLEDNSSDVVLASRFLSQRPDVNLVTVHSLPLALELAKVHHPDAIMLALNAIGMQFQEALAMLRSHGVTKHIPLVALAESATDIELRKLLEQGFHGCLSKPLRAEAFLRMLDDALNAGKIPPQ